MKSPLIPKKLEEWETSTVDELTQYVDIESESFDFKKEPSDLHEDICAMANTQDGIIVLGVTQIDSEDGKKIIRFEKTGFELGEEDTMKNTITNHAVKVEPLPVFDMKPVYDMEMNRFFMVLKIDSQVSNRPYFIKTTDQCFVRIHNSSRRVGRTAILNLFSANVELRKNIENLRISSTILKESLLHTSTDISALSWESNMKTTPIDLTLMKNAIISSESFLQENNLLGEHIDQTSFSGGFNSILHALEKLNTYLEAYNRENTSEGRRQLLGQVWSWGIGNSTVTGVAEFLDKVVLLTNKFLSKYK